MALPLLLLWFTNPNILQQQQHSTITTSPQINKQQKHLKKEENKLILENNLTKNLFSKPFANLCIVLEANWNFSSLKQIFDCFEASSIDKISFLKINLFKIKHFFITILYL